MADSPLAWKARGLCKGHDPDLWYPDERTGTAQVRKAKAICDQCPVKTECRDYAVAAYEKDGVWGGTSPRERQALRRSRRRLRPHGTRARYMQGCGCDACRHANSEYQRSHDKRLIDRPDDSWMPHLDIEAAQ